MRGHATKFSVVNTSSAQRRVGKLRGDEAPRRGHHIYRAAALWALVGRCERAKAALKAAPTLNELKIAERALTAKTMVAPPPSDSARATLDECLRAVGAVMAILRL